MLFAYVTLEIRRTLRDTGFVIFGIGMPVMMYLLFTNLGVSGSEEDKAAALTAMIGMAAYGALGSALAAGTGVAEDKGHGWLRQLRITPMSPFQVVVGRCLSGSVTVLPSIVAVLLAGGLVNGVELRPWQWAAIAVLLWAGTAPFTLLGLGNGYRLTAQTTGVVNVACNLGLSVIGGLWFPTSLFPGWLRAVSRWTPSHRFGELGWSVTGGSAPHPGTVAVLAGWTALFAVYAMYAYRRSARTV
ncbi:ABC transporter permease [Streptomyces sp. NPDC088354]|uniref:ABC transporter permease n=1 Tax=unclassified Streptomyces TaxID=2593676 RepID=UPI0029A1DA1D|nr:ABC transporter permease [Streptomyces sp. MI02-7b]MDX3075596.1 ABC transporter permease [Streptomyces sp. MI02-7b]